ncbi:MAG: hypothetical protein HQL88_01645, partial [Magnetococcales bacterium]|nr:hypothetical protein [Magnetococcales bacterium]
MKSLQTAETLRRDKEQQEGLIHQPVAAMDGLTAPHREQNHVQTVEGRDGMDVWEFPSPVPSADKEESKTGRSALESWQAPIDQPRPTVGSDPKLQLLFQEEEEEEKEEKETKGNREIQQKQDAPFAPPPILVPASPAPSAPSVAAGVTLPSRGEAPAPAAPTSMFIELPDDSEEEPQEQSPVKYLSAHLTATPVEAAGMAKAESAGIPPGGAASSPVDAALQQQKTVPVAIKNRVKRMRRYNPVLVGGGVVVLLGVVSAGYFVNEILDPAGGEFSEGISPGDSQARRPRDAAGQKPGEKQARPATPPLTAKVESQGAPARPTPSDKGAAAPASAVSGPPAPAAPAPPAPAASPPAPPAPAASPPAPPAPAAS